MDYNNIINSLIRRKRPEIDLGDSTEAWIDENNNGDFYCLLCDQVVDPSGIDFETHALYHIKEHNLLTFI